MVSLIIVQLKKKRLYEINFIQESLMIEWLWAEKGLIQKIMFPLYQDVVIHVRVSQVSKHIHIF